jgi:hypothetical protein
MFFFNGNKTGECPRIIEKSVIARAELKDEIQNMLISMGLISPSDEASELSADRHFLREWRQWAQRARQTIWRAIWAGLVGVAGSVLFIFIQRFMP